MSELDKRQEEIIEEFAFFDDWMEKYAHLIEQGKSLTLVDDGFKTKDNVIKGCQSKVWIEAAESKGILKLKGDSDSSIAKGIVALVLRVLSDLKVDDVLNADLYFIEKTGLNEHLSPSRSNGLSSMIKQVKLYALVYKQKSLLS
ncbi:MAG: cysteine desulfuration protein SufE [Patiriisocius sp.]|jgi:cysteine desulfuration protein SufE